MRVEEVILWALFWIAVVWRITALLVYDTITAPLRDQLGIRYDEYNDCKGADGTDHLLCCHKCCSIWAAFVATVVFIQPPILMHIPVILALSTGSIIVNKFVNGE